MDTQHDVLAKGSPLKYVLFLGIRYPCEISGGVCPEKVITIEQKYQIPYHNFKKKQIVHEFVGFSLGNINFAHLLFNKSKSVKHTVWSINSIKKLVFLVASFGHGSHGDVVP